MSYNDSDIAVSVLEHFFKDEIDFTSVTRSVPGIRSCRKASAINHMKRFVAEILHLPCHEVRDSRERHSHLKEKIAKALNDALEMSPSTHMVTIPDKTNQIVPLKKVEVVEPLEEQMRQVVERRNMEAEDLRLIEREETQELRQLRETLDSNRSIQKETLNSRENLKITPKKLEKMCYSYKFSDPEIAEEIYNLMYEMYEITLAMKGSVLAKHAQGLRKHNEETKEEREAAIAQNELWKKKYLERKALIREQRNMYHAELDSCYFKHVTNYETQLRNIETHNNNEKERYRRELKLLSEWQSKQDEEALSIERALDSYIAEHTRSDRTVTDLDILMGLYSVRDVFGADNTAMVKYGTKSMGIPHCFLKNFKTPDKKNFVMTTEHNISDYTFYRRDVVRLAFLIESGQVSFQGKTVPEIHQTIEDLEFYPFMGNVIIGLRWGFIASASKDGALQPTREEAMKKLNLGNKKKKVPKPPVVTKPDLKKAPSVPKESTIWEKVHREVPEPQYKSALKLKQKDYPKEKPHSQPYLGDVEDFDFFSLLYAVMHTHPAIGKKRATLIFGDVPLFRYHTFREKHKFYLYKHLSFFHEIIADWQLGLDPSKKLDRIMRDTQYGAISESLRKKKDNFYRTYSQTAPQKYRMKSKLILTEESRERVARMKQESLAISNDFHDNKPVPSKTVYLRNTGELRAKLSEINYLKVEKWDILDTVEEDFLLLCAEDNLEKGWKSRLVIRNEARRAIEAIGKCNMSSVPTHMLENFFFASSTKGFLPRLDISKFEKSRIYWRKARVALHTLVART